jgi:integral membrane protein
MDTSSAPKALQQFLITSRMEAISFLILVLIAMPLKYGMDMPLMVKYVGWAHGVLFVAYGIQLLYVAFKLKWDVLWVIYGGVAALLPFGPFIFERWLKKQS